jgi:2'-5' RNA ligase
MNTHDQDGVIKRVFFGFEVAAPWPLEWPSGRIIAETSRHITLAFLGNAHTKELLSHIHTLPRPSFKVGIVGKCDQFLFLPDGHPRVVAYHVTWMENEQPLNQFQQQLSFWLIDHHFMPKHEKRPFLSHLTVARSPFNQKEWEQTFHELPVMIKGLHLYESIGNLSYRSLWNLSFLPAFEEFAHTADIAFHIRGENYPELFYHAQIALAFKFPSLLSFFSKEQKTTIDEIIIALNEIVAVTDEKLGCPFKAISFHDKVTQDEKEILHWEMIVDV